MDLAVRTTASPAAIWAICVVAVACLAFWLSMVMIVADRPDPRRRLPELTGSVLGGVHMAAGGRSVMPTRHEAAATEEDLMAALAHEQVAGAPETAGAEPAAAETGQPAVPGQRRRGAPAEPAPAGTAGQPPEAPAQPVPSPRGAETDRPATRRGS